MIRLLVFDFDGTLLDTETPDYDSLASIYSEHGCELPLEFWALSLGTNPSPVDLFENLEMQIGQPVDREKWQSERKRRFYSLVEKEDPRPGIISLLGEVKSKGIAIGLASSAGRDWVEKHLNRTGLRDYFQCVRTVEDVTQAKPAPDLYLSVLDFFGIAGHEALAIEDSPNGVTAAKRAGLYCAAVPNPITSRLSLNGADIHLDSLAGISLVDLEAHLRNALAGRKQ